MVDGLTVVFIIATLSTKRGIRIMTAETIARPATKKQLWALFCITKKDYRDSGLTIDQASELIAELNGKKGSSENHEVKKDNWQELWDRAYAAGIAAAEATNPTPMVVSQHANPLDDSSPVTRQYFVPQGACGFAWIIIRPGNSKFANWIKKNHLGRPDSYYGGVNIWIGEHSQSHAKKYAHACAMAKVFNDAGIKATPYERLD
jgi:hypothetical protein